MQYHSKSLRKVTLKLPWTPYKFAPLGYLRSNKSYFPMVLKLRENRFSALDSICFNKTVYLKAINSDLPPVRNTFRTYPCLLNYQIMKTFIKKKKQTTNTHIYIHKNQPNNLLFFSLHDNAQESQLKMSLFPIQILINLFELCCSQQHETNN